MGRGRWVGVMCGVGLVRAAAELRAAWHCPPPGLGGNLSSCTTHGHVHGSYALAVGSGRGTWAERMHSCEREVWGQTA